VRLSRHDRRGARPARPASPLRLPGIAFVWRHVEPAQRNGQHDAGQLAARCASRKRRVRSATRPRRRSVDECTSSEAAIARRSRRIRQRRTHKRPSHRSTRWRRCTPRAKPHGDARSEVHRRQHLR
jgi:hypothetical protein